jgi:glyoxylase-like metal-dependent hydrolase (beta-lactamase superfamily II)
MPDTRRSMTVNSTHTEEHEMITTYKAAPDIDVLTTNFPIPGLGQLAINAFVLHGDVPVLVDTGPVVERESFMTALSSVIDPADLGWIWLSHTDGDHIGALGQLLAEYPDIRVVTTFLGVGIMSVSDPLPMDRVHLVNPGQSITLGSRTLTAFRPPTFDNPSTTGFFDTSSGVLFPSDCFGALLQDIPQNAADLSAVDLREGQAMWATIDSPWLHDVDRANLARALDAVARFEPSLILSSHLPAAPGGMVDQFLAALTAVPDAAPFVGPDQVGLEQMLAQMTAGPQ